MPEQLKLEAQDQNLEIIHIQELAKQLLFNENPNPQVFQIIELISIIFTNFQRFLIYNYSKGLSAKSTQTS